MKYQQLKRLEKLKKLDLIQVIADQSELIDQLRHSMKQYEKAILGISDSESKLTEKKLYESYYNRKLKKGYVTFDHKQGVKF